MKVFLSCSGKASYFYAEKMKEGIEYASDFFQPFLYNPNTSHDWYTGHGGWYGHLQDELRQSKAGLVFLTVDNYKAPWIIYEATVLAYQDNTLMIPLLIDMKPDALAEHPLYHHQVKTLVRDGKVQDDVLLEVGHLLGTHCIKHESQEVNVKLIKQKLMDWLHPERRSPPFQSERKDVPLDKEALLQALELFNQYPDLLDTFISKVQSGDNKSKMSKPPLTSVAEILDPNNDITPIKPECP